MIDLKVKKQTQKNSTLNVYNKADVPVFACLVKNITPQNVLNIVDMTKTIPENNPEYNSAEKIFPKLDSNGNAKVEYLLPGKFFTNTPTFTASGYLIATDKANESKLQDYSVPLFYEYQLMYDHLAQDPLSPQGFITIRKNNEISMDSSLYQIQRRAFPIVSGRYTNSTASGFIWGYAGSGLVNTLRVLLPVITSDEDYYTVEYNKNVNNITSEYWKELISEKKLYEPAVDYTLTASSLIFTAGTRMTSGNAIFVQKDPESFVKMLKLKDDDKEVMYHEWNLSFNVGKFVIPSGLGGLGYNSYYVNNDYGSPSYEVTEESATMISKNVIRLSNYPLKEASGMAPGYGFRDIFPFFSINGVDNINSITSVDYNRGFIFLKQEISDVDEVVVNYHTNSSGVLVIKNLQLNPTNSNSGIIDITQEAVGIAIVPSGTKFMDATSTLTSDFSNLVVYYSSDETNIGDFSAGNISGYALCAYDTIDPMQPISGVIPSGSKLLTYISVNKPLESMIELIDIRRKGGYIKKDVQSLISGWRGFSDFGFWNGESMPQAGAVLLQIPSFCYSNIYNIFKNEGK